MLSDEDRAITRRRNALQSQLENIVKPQALPTSGNKPLTVIHGMPLWTYASELLQSRDEIEKSLLLAPTISASKSIPATLGGLGLPCQDRDRPAKDLTASVVWCSWRSGHRDRERPLQPDENDG